MVSLSNPVSVIHAPFEIDAALGVMLVAHHLGVHRSQVEIGRAVFTAAGEDYFPDGMPAVAWYSPTDRGLEGKIREKLEYLRSLDREKRGNS